jgi:hypothetical protein
VLAWHRRLGLRGYRHHHLRRVSGAWRQPTQSVPAVTTTHHHNPHNRCNQNTTTTTTTTDVTTTTITTTTTAITTAVAATSTTTTTITTTKISVGMEGCISKMVQVDDKGSSRRRTEGRTHSAGRQRGARCTRQRSGGVPVRLCRTPPGGSMRGALARTHPSCASTCSSVEFTGPTCVRGTATLCVSSACVGGESEQHAMPSRWGSRASLKEAKCQR